METDLSKFNNTISQLVEALADVYQDHTEAVRDLNIFKEKFEFLRKANARKSLEQFMTHIYPFKKQIQERDEKYFLELDHTDQSLSMFKFLKIKELWMCADDQIKETIWTYFNVLILLAQKIADREVTTSA